MPVGRNQWQAGAPRRAIQAHHPTAGPQRKLTLHNRQRVRGVDLRLLRRIVQQLLQDTCRHGAYDLAFHLVATHEMTRLNETFLRHQGSTDVITFDYTDKVGQASRLSRPPVRGGGAADRRGARPIRLQGEIFICMDEAVSQARRFHASCQSELVRYAVHGLLHLLGYDDQAPHARRRMKRAEDALVRRLARQFAFRALASVGMTTGPLPRGNRRRTGE